MVQHAKRIVKLCKRLADWGVGIEYNIRDKYMVSLECERHRETKREKALLLNGAVFGSKTAQVFW
eukprot:689301-Amphidinium_carterae.1